MLDIEFAELTDTGQQREHNEDALGHVVPANPAEVQSQGFFFCVADGLGGHEHGEVASQLAVQTAIEGFRKIPKGVMHVSLLPRLVQEANAAVFEAGHAKSMHGPTTGASMGTTFVACALRFDSAVVSHVGDSRCYLFRNTAGPSLAQLTRDHTMAGEQLRMGLLSQEEAATGEGRHVLTRSLGSEMFVAADTVTVSVQPGDVLLLCTDGLHGYVNDATIRQTLQTYTDLKRAAAALVTLANNAGGYDNVTVQLIRVRNVERMGLYRGRPYRLL
jgi:serine/threonine protein phosphatase PrpC